MALQPGLAALLQVALVDLRSGRIPSSAVLSLLFSKALGLAILAFSFVVKVPQIRALQKSHSAEGLSSISFELEQLGLSVHTAFGFLMNLPFNTFGEALIILVQNTILLTLLYKYKPVSNTRPAIGVALTAIGISACYYGYVSKLYIGLAYEFNSVIFTAARLPQIYSNYKNKSTGQLSNATYIANFGGCIARMFTSYKEGGGISMIRAYALGGILNGTIMSQIFYYGGKSKAKKL